MTIEIEHRKFDRFPLNVDCEIRVNGNRYRGYINNISPGGLLLELSNTLLPNSLKGQDCVLFFQEGTREVTLTCTIQWIIQTRVGIQFLENK